MMANHLRPRATLVEPPKPLPHASPIETLLHLHPLTDISTTTFTNAYPLWRPPGARGLYGGASIAQSLLAAQATAPANFVVHSMHCYFILAGDTGIPVVYEVEKVRDGRSFVTRSVQTRQRGKCICMTMISFMKGGSGGQNVIEHQPPMPVDVCLPPESQVDDIQDTSRGKKASGTPFESFFCGSSSQQTGRPEEGKVRRWIRARGRISDEQARKRTEDGVEVRRGNNCSAHLAALAYMSDSFFLGTAPRVHNLVRFPDERIDDGTISANEDKEVGSGAGPRKQLGMMVSLDHSIFFHNPTEFRADEWMLTETDSPWAGESRGFVSQKIWSKDGVLIATCTQEGLVRLKQESASKL